MGVNWFGVFQVIAFFLGWNAALDSPHPIGSFFGTWFTFAAIFAGMALLIATATRGRWGGSSGEGPGSNNEGGGGDGGGGGGGA